MIWTLTLWCNGFVSKLSVFSQKSSSLLWSRAGSWKTCNLLENVFPVSPCILWALCLQKWDFHEEEWKPEVQGREEPNQSSSLKYSCSKCLSVIKPVLTQWSISEHVLGTSRLGWIKQVLRNAGGSRSPLPLQKCYVCISCPSDFSWLML